MLPLTLLDDRNPNEPFPKLEKALKNPDGLLAVGGCLSQTRLLNAYRHGIFPWFNENEPILWWSPNPRLVLFPNQLVISTSLSKTIRKNVFSVTFNNAFEKVIEACGKTRENTTGTWITNDIKNAYCKLHQHGFAHSVEVWYESELVGGLYGVAIGQVFFGESMFHTKTDASKVGFVLLVEKLKLWNYQLIDCQIYSQHLVSLGAEMIQRKHFSQLLIDFCEKPPVKTAWL